MKTNTKPNQSGFTIVELLIVIVVIAILAAISIVAYNGIQNRGKQSAAQSLASQVAKKAEAYNTVQSSYPANVTAFANVDEAKLDNSSSVSDATNPTTEKTVRYKTCSGGGAQVIWWNATAPSGNTNKLETIGLGGAASSTVGGSSVVSPCA